MQRSPFLTILLCRMTLMTLLTVAPALAQHSVPFPHGSPHAEAHDRHDLGGPAEVWEGWRKVLPIRNVTIMWPASWSC